MNYTGTRWQLTRITGNVPQAITVQMTNPNSLRGHKFREIAREDSITIQYVHNSCNYLHSFYSRIWSMNLLLYAQPYLHQRIKSTRNKTLSLCLLFFSLRYLPSHINLLNRGQWRGRAAAGENSFTVKKWLEAKKTHHFQHILVLARIRRTSAIFFYWQAINPTSYTLFFFFFFFLPFFFLFLSSPPHIYVQYFLR